MTSRLERLGLKSVLDLINHYPFRYDDYSKVSNAVEVPLGEKVTLQGEIWSIQNVFTRFGKVLTKAIFNDGSGPIELVWFNQSWLPKSIKTGDRLQISGKVEKRGSKLTMTAPVWEKLQAGLANEAIHTGRLVPVYPETYGVTSKWLRLKISTVLPLAAKEIQDPIPDILRDSMLPLREALNKIHFPDSWEAVNRATERLSFDELFSIQLATLKARSQWKKREVVAPLKIDHKEMQRLIASLPFTLTHSQDMVIDEIIADLSSSQPMNRLVQGEVGSGKTVIAAIVIYLAYLNKKKALYMAPTEILAFQHQTTVKRILKPFGVAVGIYTGSRKEALDSDVIIGTHALLSNKLNSEDVGLIVIDEQQRFGVEQRSVLRSKGTLPHFLSMTATPIPRTVALTLYGDLDLSVITELPKGRKRVKTFVVPSKKRQDGYAFIEKKVSEGDQVYIITPLIEESETLTSVKAAKLEYDRLKKAVFPSLKLGLLHGKLSSKEKEQVINGFKDQKIDILVSTSVVEVGMDVTNATIMVIEGAERFGLAQLHQLRGRVGRGEKESFCFLFSSDENPQNMSRLKNLERTYDGLKLSELDLKMRGSGDIFGIRQSGRWELKIADLSDLAMIERTRQAATELLKIDPNLDKHPLLKAKLQDLVPDVMPD